MKTILKNLAFILILTISNGSLVAQESINNETVESLLIGTWALDYDKSIGQLEPEPKAYYDNLDDEKKGRIKNSFSKRKITFMEGGGYILEVSPEKQLHGTWQLQDHAKSLKIIMDGGNQLDQHIEDITGLTLYLDMGGNRSVNRLFRKWHLSKISQ